MIHEKIYQRLHKGQLPPSTHSIFRGAIRGIPDGVMYGTAFSIMTYMGTSAWLAWIYRDLNVIDPTGFSEDLLKGFVGIPASAFALSVGLAAGPALAALHVLRGRRAATIATKNIKNIRTQ